MPKEREAERVLYENLWYNYCEQVPVVIDNEW